MVRYDFLILNYLRPVIVDVLYSYGKPQLGLAPEWLAPVACSHLGKEKKSMLVSNSM